MTRINTIPVQELCDSHILAEIREITRIPNTINIRSSKWISFNCNIKRYTIRNILGHQAWYRIEGRVFISLIIGLLSVE